MHYDLCRQRVLKWLANSSFAVALFAAAGPAHADGKTLFQQKCAACHSIGGGKLVGPDLQGVVQKRDRAWLTRWIREPDAMLAEKDATAVALLQEYNNVPMPNLGVSEADATAIVAYLETTGGSAPAPTTPAPAPATLPAPTRDEITLGQNLFQGTVRFTNGGPSCISCHHVKNDAVIGGGILAKELTTVFSRMGGPGVRAILGGPPFPVMQAAYLDRAFTDEETQALVAFLQYADREHAYQQPRDYGWGLFIAGVCGVLVLAGLIALLGCRRKKQSVNQSIYDRQIKSE
ncbi:MAG: cytochrome c [Deltaproteobacteria bacterium]|nr:cytochrome c [Deltaproteobacteria bacterium]